MSRPILWLTVQAIRIVPGHEDMQDGVRQGPKGPLHEHRLHVRPWVFDLESIEPNVHLWHGEQDRWAPVTMAEYVAAQLPSNTLQTYPEEGHRLGDHDEEIPSTLSSQ